MIDFSFYQKPVKYEELNSLLKMDRLYAGCKGWMVQVRNSERMEKIYHEVE